MTGPPRLSAAYERARADLAVVDPPPEADSWDEPEADPAPPRALRFQRFADLAAEVDAAGPRTYLVRGLWPAGDYGVVSAEPKAGKSWAAADLAVSVATGTPWLGAFPVDQQGAVVWFVGEGGRGNTVRRVRAVSRARSLPSDDLDLDVVSRAPRLGNDEHMRELAEHLEQRRPALVIVDPLYLATGSAAKIGDLPAMGALLERPQLICQHVGAALVVVHHNRRGDGNGVSKMSGAGPEEWGRVLISGSVRTRTTDTTTGATTVVSDLEVRGGEIADRTVRVTRRVWADDPDDLDSPLHVHTEVGAPDPSTDAPARTRGRTPGTDGGDDLPPAAGKLLEALRAADRPLSGSQLVDWIADHHGHGLKRTTWSRSLSQLASRGLAYAEPVPVGVEKLWRAVDSADVLPLEPGSDPMCSPRDCTCAEHMTGGPCAPCARRVLSPTGRGEHTSTRAHGARRPAEGDEHTTRAHDAWRVSGQPLPPEPEPEEDR